MSPHAQLYTAPFCADCDRARALLERAEISFEEIDLGRDLERCCQLQALTGGRWCRRRCRCGVLSLAVRAGR